MQRDSCILFAIMNKRQMLAQFYTQAATKTCTRAPRRHNTQASRVRGPHTKPQPQAHRCYAAKSSRNMTQRVPQEPTSRRISWAIPYRRASAATVAGLLPLVVVSFRSVSGHMTNARMTRLSDPESRWCSRGASKSSAGVPGRPLGSAPPSSNTCTRFECAWEGGRWGKGVRAHRGQLSPTTSHPQPYHVPCGNEQKYNTNQPRGSG
jgi:hypothetical protein